MTSIIEWCNANQGFIMALLTLVYVLLTLWLAYAAHRSTSIAQKNVATLIRLDEERLRPLVTVEMILDMTLVDLRITNRGQTAAYSISFAIQPTIKLLLGGQYVSPPGKVEKPIRFLEDGIKALAPSASVQTLVGSFLRVQEFYPELLFLGKVLYHNSKGTTYEEPISVDLRHHVGSLNVRRKTIDDLVNELERIRTDIGHLATGFHKPHVIVQHMNEYRAEQQEFIKRANEQAEENKTYEQGG